MYYARRSSFNNQTLRVYIEFDGSQKVYNIIYCIYIILRDVCYIRCETRSSLENTSIHYRKFSSSD